MQAWKSDVVTLASRYDKLARNTQTQGKMVTAQVNKEIQTALTRVGKASEVLEVHGFGSAEEGLVCLSSQLELISLAHRKLDSISKLALDSTGGAQKADAAKPSGLVKMPASTLDCVNRLLAYFELHRRKSSVGNANATKAAAQNASLLVEKQRLEEALDRAVAEAAAAKQSFEGERRKVEKAEADAKVEREKWNAQALRVQNEVDGRAAAEQALTASRAELEQLRESLSASRRELEEARDAAAKSAAADAAAAGMHEELRLAKTTAAAANDALAESQGLLDEKDAALVAARQREQELLEQRLSLEQRVSDLREAAEAREAAGEAAQAAKAAKAAEAAQEREAAEAASRLELKLAERRQEQEGQEMGEFVKQLGVLLNARPLLLDTLQVQRCPTDFHKKK